MSSIATAAADRSCATKDDRPDVIQPVDAPADPRIADYAHVGDPIWLRQHGLFVAEGRLVVRRLLQSARFEVRSLLVTASALQALADVVDSVRCPIYVCDQRLLNGVTGFNFHRGCLAMAIRRDEDGLPPAQLSAAPRLLALEGVGNPDNVGGLFRVAAAFGAAVLLGPGTGDPLYRKAIRTSMGAALQIPFAPVDSWPSGLAGFRAAGFSLVALTPDPAALPIGPFAASVLPTARLLLMLGAEGAGLTPEALGIADHRVRIPIAANVDSLNVVVAAAIALAFLSRSPNTDSGFGIEDSGLRIRD
jgi:tRNA G18 (ribose-2'-O)-methylase SpoU